jgi:DNA polymerase III epsilon subunit-like protein
LKLLYLDCETGGLNPNVNPILDLTMMAEVDGACSVAFKTKIFPFKGSVIDPKALLCNGLEIPEWPSDEWLSEDKAHTAMRQYLESFVDKYEVSDKLVPVAYNGGFDLSFLSKLFERRKDKFIGGLIDRNRLIDPLAQIRWLLFTGQLALPTGHKLTLSAMAEYFNIPVLKAHDSLSDVMTLRALTARLKEFRSEIEA